MTIEKLKKRDGRLVAFDKEKIAAAIAKAFEATYKPGQEDRAAALAEEVLSILEVEGTAAPEVEHIQDIVERVLMDNGYVQTAKAYILYRNERSRAREMNTRLMKTYEEITFSPYPYAGDPYSPTQQLLLHHSSIITNLGNICNRVDGSFILAAGKPDRGVGTYVSVMKRGVGSRLRNANVSCTAFLFVSAGNSIWAEEILPPPPGGNRRDFMRYSM